MEVFANIPKLAVPNSTRHGHDTSIQPHRQTVMGDIAPLLPTYISNSTVHMRLSETDTRGICDSDGSSDDEDVRCTRRAPRRSTSSMLCLCEGNNVAQFKANLPSSTDRLVLHTRVSSRRAMHGEWLAITQRVDRLSMCGVGTQFNLRATPLPTYLIRANVHGAAPDQVVVTESTVVQPKRAHIPTRRGGHRSTGRSEWGPRTLRNTLRNAHPAGVKYLLIRPGAPPVEVESVESAPYTSTPPRKSRLVLRTNMGMPPGEADMLLFPQYICTPLEVGAILNCLPPELVVPCATPRDKPKHASSKYTMYTHGQVPLASPVVPCIDGLLAAFSSAMSAAASESHLTARPVMSGVDHYPNTNCTITISLYAPANNTHRMFTTIRDHYPMLSDAAINSMPFCWNILGVASWARDPLHELLSCRPDVTATGFPEYTTSLPVMASILACLPPALPLLNSYTATTGEEGRLAIECLYKSWRGECLASNTGPTDSWTDIQVKMHSQGGVFKDACLAGRAVIGALVDVGVISHHTHTHTHTATDAHTANGIAAIVGGNGGGRPDTNEETKGKCDTGDASHPPIVELPTTASTSRGREGSVSSEETVVWGVVTALYQSSEDGIIMTMRAPGASAATMVPPTTSLSVRLHDGRRHILMSTKLSQSLGVPISGVVIGDLLATGTGPVCMPPCPAMVNVREHDSGRSVDVVVASLPDQPGESQDIDIPIQVPSMAIDAPAAHGTECPWTVTMYPGHAWGHHCLRWISHTG